MTIHPQGLSDPGSLLRLVMILRCLGCGPTLSGAQRRFLHTNQSAPSQSVSASCRNSDASCIKRTTRTACDQQQYRKHSSEESGVSRRLNMETVV